MRIVLATPFAALLLVGPARAQQKNPLAAQPPALTELRGSWKVTDVPVSGPTRLVFEGDKIIICRGDTFKTERRFKVDPKTKPAQIDVLAGESKAPGIYELSGDTLRICLAKWAADRPTEFKTAKGVVCLTLTRESEKTDKTEAPKPLPPEIVKAWREAGFEAGWMKDVPPHQGRSWGFWRPWREKAEARAIPAFGHPRRDAGGVLAKLPDPGTAFGLDFHCGWDAGVPLKEFAKLKNLQSLNLGAVRSPDRPKAYADLNDLAELTNLRALYLFYMPVADADLRHVAALKNLRVLDLSSTRVTDAGIKELAALKDLRWLNLQTPRVTAKGLAALRKELPNCKILTYDSADTDSPEQKQPTNKGNFKKTLVMVEVPCPNSGTYTTEEATALFPKAMARSRAVEPTSALVAGWKNPTVGFRVHVTANADIEIVNNFGEKQSGFDALKSAIESSEAMVRGNVASVLLTSATDGWKTDEKRQILKALFRPSIQLYIVTDAVAPDSKAGRQAPVTTKEMPKGWRLDDIADAAPPRGDAGPTHVLAWKIVKDDRPLRLEYCLALKELKKPTKDRGRWVLASLVRNPAKGEEWNFVTIWISPDPDFKNPPFIMYIEEYKDRPKNAEIYRFMDKYRWTLGSGDGWDLIDGGVCAAWEKVVREKPTRSFKTGARPPERFYKVDQKMCDKIQDGMTESTVRGIVGGPPHAEWHTVFAAPFSRKAMPVTLKQWWGEKNLIEVHFDGPTKEVIYKRILDGIGGRFSRQSRPTGGPELTPDACKQAILDMMRSKPGQALGFFEAKLVDEMEKMPVEKKKGEYHWTGAYRFRPPKDRAYELFVSLGDDRPPLRPHPKGFLIGLRVFEGTFEMRDGRWVATVPTYKYTLLD
jgi:uncharacterized protein (TIGR03067 family)